MMAAVHHLSLYFSFVKAKPHKCENPRDGDEWRYRRRVDFRAYEVWALVGIQL